VNSTYAFRILRQIEKQHIPSPLSRWEGQAEIGAEACSEIGQQWFLVCLTRKGYFFSASINPNSS
jgi:hypothetical protein